MNPHSRNTCMESKVSGSVQALISFALARKVEFTVLPRLLFCSAREQLGTGTLGKLLSKFSYVQSRIEPEGEIGQERRPYIFEFCPDFFRKTDTQHHVWVQPG